MAIFRRGMRGSYVKELQKALNDKYNAGLAIDGIYGPLTEAAVNVAKKDAGLSVNGIAGPKLYQHLGMTSAGASSGDADPGATDYTDDEQTRFNSLPGKPELWKESDTGKTWVVYYVPGVDPPIPIMFSVATDEDMKAFFGDKTPVVDKTVTTEEINSTGALRWGTTDEIPRTEGDPWTGFIHRMERAKETQPWLNDAEVFSVFAAAWLEGREPERWELEGTDWWQSRNDEQQEWAWLASRNPTEAQQLRDDNYIAAYEVFKGMGLYEVSHELVQFVADHFTMGDWSSRYLSDQIEAVVWGDSFNPIDIDLANFMSENSIEVGQPAGQVSDVKAAFDRWLGPAHPPTEAQLAEWSSKVRRNPDVGMDELTEQLRSQRMALFPEYEDDSLTYDDIAGPWRGFAEGAWGQGNVDETNATFQQLIRMNDAVEGGKLLRSEGFKQGNEQVRRSALQGIGDQTTTIRRAV